MNNQKSKKSVAKDFEFLLNAPLFFDSKAPEVTFKIVSEQERSLYISKLPKDISNCPWTISAVDALHWKSLCERFNEKSHAAGFWELAQAQIDTITSGRLGIRYEGLVLFFLQQILGDALVHFHVAVRESVSGGVHTWGEMDVVFRDPLFPDTVFHWELSAKFYLCLDRGLPNFRWQDCVGPSAVDRLDLKGPKMFLQQMKLSQTTLGRACIPNIKDHEIIRAQALTQGVIFKPFGCLVKPPVGLCNHLQSGTWLTFQQLQTLREKSPDAKVKILGRLQWFNAEEPELLWQEALDFITSHMSFYEVRNECIHLELVSTNELKTTERLFLVTEKWLLLVKP
jgi:hypothetical protein